MGHNKYIQNLKVKLRGNFNFAILIGSERAVLCQQHYVGSDK
jgi:hypothetical protein